MWLIIIVIISNEKKYKNLIILQIKISHFKKR